MKRPRSARSVASECSKSSSDGNSIRMVPHPSRADACCACGSHLTQFQFSLSGLEVTTAICRWSGPWNAHNSKIIERTNCRHMVRSPSKLTVGKARSDTAVGKACTTECALTKRRNAIVDTGSRSSGGPVSGAISRVARRWVPTPTRTWQKSVSVGRRSHMRRVPATSMRVRGSG